MAQSEEERFVEQWIARNVKAEGYEADGDHARELAERLVADAPHDRAEIEAEIGDLEARMAAAIQQATESEMMERDGRHEYSGVELPVEGKEEALEAEAEEARRKADD